MRRLQMDPCGRLMNGDAASYYPWRGLISTSHEMLAWLQLPIQMNCYLRWIFVNIWKEPVTFTINAKRVSMLCEYVVNLF